MSPKTSLFFGNSSKKTMIPDMATEERDIFITEPLRMSKYEIIDCIMNINKTASQEFLDQFTVEDLDLYLEHLMQVDLEEIALCA